MGISNIDGNLLKNMIIAGANELSRHRQLVDGLNVFPVPDGDTGTNMSLTVLSAAKEVEKLHTPHVYDVAKAASTGALRGARGNSGVIVSQLFRGFAKGLEGKELATVDDLVAGLQGAQEVAYKAVMKPKEGTILTVARVLAEKALEISLDTNDIQEFLKQLLQEGEIILAQTTEMLPELKQAGVVDAGGKGLLFVLQGAYESLSKTEEIKLETVQEQKETPSNVFSGIKTEDITFAYCTEFFVNTPNGTEERTESLKEFLKSVGDSIVMVEDDDLIKIHVHTNHPGNVLERALKVGTLSSIKIENMKEQHTSMIRFVEEEAPQSTPPKAVGFVAVCMGAGLKELFLQYGVDVVIEGGQTMNPSTEDLLAAVAKVNANTVVVFPNNKNIILAANQAAELATDKKIVVVPTQTIPQGFSAIIQYISTNSLEDNIQTMTDAMAQVQTGQVTYAVRNTVIDGQEIEEGDILCMINGKIALVSKDVQQGTTELLKQMMVRGDEFVCLYSGEDVDETMTETIQKDIATQFPECEIEVHEGGQPLYYYLISAE